MPTDPVDIAAYHAHVYFGPETLALAVALCERARDRFGLTMGRVHERPVGPHPQWSCQLSFAAERFADVVPWLLLNRGPLTIFVHPETGDPLRDHTGHQMWLCPGDTLDTSGFVAGARRKGAGKPPAALSRGPRRKAP